MPNHLALLAVATGVAERGNQVDQVLFVLQTGVVHNTVANLTLEGSPGGERFREEHGIVVSDDVFEGVRIRQSEAFGHFHVAAKAPCRAALEHLVI